MQTHIEANGCKSVILQCSCCRHDRRIHSIVVLLWPWWPQNDIEWNSVQDR